MAGETQHLTPAASTSLRISMPTSPLVHITSLREKASYIDASFPSIESPDGRPPSFIILLLRLPPTGFHPHSMSMSAITRRRPMTQHHLSSQAFSCTLGSGLIMRPAELRQNHVTGRHRARSFNRLFLFNWNKTKSKIMKRINLGAVAGAVAGSRLPRVGIELCGGDLLALAPGKASLRTPRSCPQ